MFHHRQNNLFTGVLEPPGSSFTWKRSFKFSFTTIVIQLRYSRVLLQPTKFTIPSSLLSRERECDFTDIKESRLKDEKYSKMSKDAKQYALQTCAGTEYDPV